MREVKKLEHAIDDLEFGLWNTDDSVLVTDTDDMAAMLECLDIDDANKVLVDALMLFCANLKEKYIEDLGTLWDEIEKNK